MWQWTETSCVFESLSIVVLLMFVWVIKEILENVCARMNLYIEGQTLIDHFPVTSIYCQIKICKVWSNLEDYNKCSFRLKAEIYEQMKIMLHEFRGRILQSPIKEIPPSFPWICSTHLVNHCSHEYPTIHCGPVNCLMVHSSDHRPCYMYICVSCGQWKTHDIIWINEKVTVTCKHWKS